MDQQHVTRTAQDSSSGERCCAALEPGAASAAAVLAHALVVPLAARIRRGEGGVLLVAWVAIALSPAATWSEIVDRGVAAMPALAARAALAVPFLAALYGVNDLADRHHDLRDPGKDHAAARFLVAHGRDVRAVLVAISLTVVGAAFATGVWYGAIAIAVLAVNTAYSLGLKGRPLVDLACAAAWGFGFVSAAEPSAWTLAVLAGAMVTTCHVFQARRDNASDRSDGLRTCAVAAPRRSVGVVAVASAAMAWVFVGAGGPGLAASAVLPFALAVLPLPNGTAWTAARCWFAVALSLHVLALVPRG